MALAEPRRRQKWTLNPRGNIWANDESKFGKKLMEKMGWEEGKGLGANQDGITAPITARHKSDNKGIGHEGHDDTWLEHQDDFAAVLAALNAEHGDKTETTEEAAEETKSKSLEANSKQSKARVHYAKFTRGKDLSKYSADDLGCILGTKSDKIKQKRKKLSDFLEKEEEDEPTEIGKEDKSHGLVTVSGGSYQDYFKKKMAALRSKGKQTYTPNDDQPEENSEEDLECAMTGFKSTVDTPLDTPLDTPPASPEDSSDVPEKKKKKKKSKKEEKPTEEPVKEETPEPESEKKKKKKSKKSKKEDLEQPSADKTPTEEAAIIVEPEEKPKKKSKKSKKEEVEQEDLSHSEELNEDETEEKQKKKKNKKVKKEKTTVEDTAEEPPANDSGCEQEEQKQKKKKKGKKEKLEKIEPEKKRKHEEDAPEEPSRKKRKHRIEPEGPQSLPDNVANSDEKSGKEDDNLQKKNKKGVGFIGANLLAIAGYGR